MYRNTEYRPAGNIHTVGAVAKPRVLQPAEIKGLEEMYRKMGADGVRRHLQTSGWHNALGDPAIRAFAYEWLAEAELRRGRIGILHRTAIFAAVVFLAGFAGYLGTSSTGVPELIAALIP